MPRLAIASAVTGGLLLAGAPVAWQLSQPADTGGEVPASGTFAAAAEDAAPEPELPFQDIFTRCGDTRMVLITCGGAFDNTTRHYEDNVVVYTEPVTPASA